MEIRKIIKSMSDQEVTHRSLDLETTQTTAELQTQRLKSLYWNVADSTRNEQSQLVEEIVTPPVAELQTVMEAGQDDPAPADIYQAQAFQDMASQYEMGLTQGQWTHTAAHPQQYLPQGQPPPGIPVGFYPQHMMPYGPQYWHPFAHLQAQQPGRLPTPSTSPPHPLPQYNYAPVANTAQKVRKPAQDKKHRCDICFKYFLRPSALDTHQSVHTKNTPYKCPIEDCQRHTRGFSVKSNMVRHCRNGHADKADFLAQQAIHLAPKGRGSP